jgi:hypothetical protein
MPEPLRAGERLSQPDYKADFRAVEWTIEGHESWKLERRQHFREPGRASWEAFERGDWMQALDLIEDMRESATQFQAKASSLGIDLYRARVVEQPISPYLQWELHSLKMRAECGELIRVVPVDLVRGLEADGELPELITLGPSILYEILYTDDGEPAGGVKITDPRVVAHVEEISRYLYEAGEDLATFFEREVAPLPPPSGDRVPG